MFSFQQAWLLGNYYDLFMRKLQCLAFNQHVQCGIIMIYTYKSDNV